LCCRSSGFIFRLLVYIFNLTMHYIDEILNVILETVFFSLFNINFINLPRTNSYYDLLMKFPCKPIILTTSKKKSYIKQYFERHKINSRRRDHSRLVGLFIVTNIFHEPSPKKEAMFKSLVSGDGSYCSWL
jgi:hypothetical protein